MKRNHLPIILGMALIALLMGSCDALFENQFGNAGLWQPTAAELAAQASDSNPAVAQPALSLQVDNKLKASGAAPIVENLVPTLINEGSKLSTIGTNSGDMNTFLEKLVPSETLDDPVALAKAINGIISTGVELDALANSAGASTSYAASGINTQQLATTAVLATVFKTMTVVGTSTAANVGEALAEFVTTPGAIITDYIDFTAFSTTDLTASGTTANTLLLLAGIDVGSWL